MGVWMCVCWINRLLVQLMSDQSINQSNQPLQAHICFGRINCSPSQSHKRNHAVSEAGWSLSFIAAASRSIHPDAVLSTITSDSSDCPGTGKNLGSSSGLAAVAVAAIAPPPPSSHPHRAIHSRLSRTSVVGSILASHAPPMPAGASTLCTVYRPVPFRTHITWCVLTHIYVKQYSHRCVCPANHLSCVADGAGACVFVHAPMYVHILWSVHTAPASATNRRLYQSTHHLPSVPRGQFTPQK